MGTDHLRHSAKKRYRATSRFLQGLRAAFRSHITSDTLWALLLGDKVPTKLQQQILLDHFRSHGWKVTPRDFVRGTAASNHPMLINLRMLRRTLSRSELESLFF